LTDSWKDDRTGADSGIDGNTVTVVKTKEGANEYFEAELANGSTEVTKVVVSTGAAGELTRDLLVSVDGRRCGRVPFNAGKNKEYTIECPEKTVGNNIQVSVFSEQVLSFADIKVYGYSCSEQKKGGALVASTKDYSVVGQGVQCAKMEDIANKDDADACSDMVKKNGHRFRFGGER
jgi:hypothetical protein